MKRYIYTLLAAAAVMSTAACTKDEIALTSPKGQLRTFTCALGEEDTRTDITSQGKTVWAEGDRIWVSNGRECDTVTVDSKSAGTKYFEFSTTLQDTIYVVYPVESALGIVDGQIKLNVPNTQGGTFSSANISAAIAKDRMVKMKNVTSVLQFRIPATAKPVKVVSVNAMDNAVAGTMSVDLWKDTPVVTPGETLTDAIVKTDGLAGKFYVAVIPGKYNAGFSLTAVSTDLKNACESVSTVAEKTLAVNDLYDLGEIGTDLKPLQGDGSQGNPWQISSEAEYLALSYYIRDGHTMAGEYVKLTSSLKGISSPLGVYNWGNDHATDVAFKGNFDGNGQQININMSQWENSAIALFANVADSAVISNVKVGGTATSSADCAAGLVSYISTQTAPVSIKDCSSSVNVKGKANCGGLVGYATSSENNLVTIDNCTNSGNVECSSYGIGGILGNAGDATADIITGCTNTGNISGTTNIGGICGYGYGIILKNDKNSGNVTSSENQGAVYSVSYNKGFRGSFGTGYAQATGGICGWTYGGGATDCTNTGKVTGINKIGGICGATYWSSVTNCTNAGEVHSTQYGVMGGIVGWMMTSGNISDCTNTGKIIGDDKSGWVGGIAGHICPQVGKSNSLNLYRCINKGEVTGTGQGVGGIIGYDVLISNGGNRVMTYYCQNEGKVTGVTDVGGIVGYTYDWGSWTMAVIYNCTNKGEISGNQHTGGILGGLKNYQTKARTDVSNCVNEGTINSTLTSADNGDYAAGIVGYSNGGTVAGTGTRIDNCLNTGDITYATASHVKLYIGGICGYNRGGRVWNCYSSGAIRTTGEAAEGSGAYCGALVGYTSNSSLSNSFYLRGTYSAAEGTSSAVKGDATVSSCDQSGVLDNAVTLSSVSYTNVADALNAYVSANSFYNKWKAGPSFSFSGNMNSGDFDIPTGGNI